MRIKTNIVKLLAVLAILGSLVAIVAVPASAVAASFTLNPIGGPVGSAVTITASNYPTNSVLSAKFDGVPVATSPATVTVAGVTTVFTITVPTTTAGTHVITVLQDGINPLTQPFTVQPKVTVTSPTAKQGPVGSAVTVAGTGFSGGSVSATVTIGGQTLAVVSVDSTGSFTASGNVPSVPAGAQPVSASDGAGNNAYVAPGTPPGWDNRDSFGVTPTLVVSPTSGLAGSKVTISGTGWSPNQVGTIVLKLTGQSWITASTDQYGNILPSTQGTITPSSPLGANQIVGYDSGYPAVPAATTTFTVLARSLTVTPVSSGPRGTQLLITGTNMTPTTSNPVWNSKIVAGQLKMGNIGLNALDITIDTQGVISPTTVWVPPAALLGANIIMATDNSGLVATATFTVTQPSIVINLATGPRGTSVIVSGAGWLAPSTTLDNSVTVAFCALGQKTPLFANSRITSVPDSTGSFSAAITVPNVGAAGQYSIYAKDGNSNEAALATFTVPGAAITVSPASGVALDTITVTGTGFKPYWGITVSLGGYNFPQQVFSDVLGAFTFSGQVPGLAPGATVVSATDSTTTVPGSTATTFFTINQGVPTTKNQVASISSQLVRIWGYSGGTWYMYDPTDAAGSNLATLTSGNGYWINVNAACTLVEGGFSKALSVGWNLMGQP
jgi:hypothetical protein